MLLFARTDRDEARRKGLGSRGGRVFGLMRRRLRAAAASLGVDLVVAGADRATSTLEQRGLDFGARLSNAVGDAFGLGYREVVVVGLDSPGLGRRHLASAFERLSRAPAVFGPSLDGGVYLLGLRADGLHALRGVRWCTRHVYADLCAGTPDAVRLERLGDIDAPEDAARLAIADHELQAILRSLRGPARPASVGLVSAGRRVSRSPRIRGPPV